MDFIKYLFAEFERLLYFGVESESEPEPEPEPEIINLQANPCDDTIGLQPRNTYTICDNV